MSYGIIICKSASFRQLQPLAVQVKLITPRLCSLGSYTNNRKLGCFCYKRKLPTAPPSQASALWVTWGSPEGMGSVGWLLQRWF